MLQGKVQRYAVVCGSQQDSAEYYSRPLAKGWKCGVPSRELNELPEVPNSLHPNKVKVKHNNMNLLIPALTICSLTGDFFTLSLAKSLIQGNVWLRIKLVIFCNVKHFHVLFLGCIPVQLDTINIILLFSFFSTHMLSALKSVWKWYQADITHKAVTMC